MEKRIVREKIFDKHIGNGDERKVFVSDLPKDILPTDEINIIRDSGHFSEDWSYDAYTQLEVYRERIETDEEFEKRVDEMNKLKERSRKKRYEVYLEYKKEFEPNNHVTILKAKIKQWDELAKDNDNNKHNLSTSERQDWIDELKDLN